MYRLLDGLAKPHVRTANLREPGRSRGKRLFHVGDLLNFLDSISTQRASGEVPGGGANPSTTEDGPE
jgi:hypothetical protein